MAMAFSLSSTNHFSLQNLKFPYSNSITCKIRNENENMIRRNLLFGLGLSLTPAAQSAPISSPDLSKCIPADIPPSAQPINKTCCPPVDPNILEFKPTGGPMRTRMPAHLVDEVYVEKYAKAIALMKELPSDDPRSFVQQSNIHCAYCNGCYNQVGFPNAKLQIHNSWLFFPWHRCFLYFHEKILGHLIDDPTFSLPYWNWDIENGMAFPTIYLDPKSSLYNPKREPLHLPPSFMDLGFGGTDQNLSPKQQLAINNSLLYRQMVSNGKSKELFLGSAYRAGDESVGGGGSLEIGCHGGVHVWSGNSKEKLEDMGNFYSAARDPLFMAHHSQIDRLWVVWKSLSNKNTDHTDPDFLEASFLFYDEGKNLVRIRVKDVLDTSSLRYNYQPAPLLWLKARPTSLRASQRGEKNGVLRKNENLEFPKALDFAFTVSIERPKQGTIIEKEAEEEILIIQEISFYEDELVKFDVYVNDKEDKRPTPENSEFAGNFLNVPHGNKGQKMKTTLKLGLGDLLEDLEAENEQELLVTIVPRVGEDVMIGGIKIGLV